MQDGKEPHLSRELSAQVSRALSDVAAALATLGRALNGEGNFSAQSSPAPAGANGLTVTEAVNEFLRAKARAGKSDRYLRALRVSLSAFAQGRGRTPLSEVSHGELEKWLNASQWKPRTQRGYLSDVRTLYNFHLKRNQVRHNPANAVALPECDPSRVSIHTPEQVRQVLTFARRYDANLCRCLAIRYFAGLRSSEADRLSEVEIKTNHIEVTATSAKTRRRRLVTIQPCLAAWLALGGSLDFGDRSNRWRWFTAALLKHRGIDWPHNVTRHCFCSYHLAHWRNAGETALEAGHTEQMLFSHYREIVTPEAAADFWGIVPG